MLLYLFHRDENFGALRMRPPAVSSRSFLLILLFPIRIFPLVRSVTRKRRSLRERNIVFIEKTGEDDESYTNR